jgi:hypothetical protein
VYLDTAKSSALLTAADIRTLFSNIHDVKEFSCDFLELLRGSQCDEMSRDQLWQQWGDSLSKQSRQNVLPHEYSGLGIFASAQHSSDDDKMGLAEVVLNTVGVANCLDLLI